MNRTGLLVALAVAAVAGLVFGIFPQLDIAISRIFFEHFNSSFPKSDASVDLARDIFSLLIAALAAPGFIALALKLILPRRPMIIPARAAVLLAVTIALGPGLMTNVILKDYWGRSRPYAVSEFRGPEKFTAWWDPRGACIGNCSFVAGEPSGAFWTLAPAAVLVPAPYRALAYSAAIAFGVGVGVLRIASGAHFASDVIFAGVLIFLVIWLVYGLLYRWRPTRISDEKLERDIVGVTLPLYEWLVLLPAANRQSKKRKMKRPASRRARLP
jgi:membrane-associated PAP2 superfamily phosphatase